MSGEKKAKATDIKSTIQVIALTADGDGDDAGLVEVRLARPPVNALSTAFLEHFEATLSALERDPAVRGVLLTSAFGITCKAATAAAAATASSASSAASATPDGGNGKGVFSGGLDLREAMKLLETEEGAQRFRKRAAAGMSAPLRFAKPIACVVDGTAVAGGMLLACACDYAALHSSTAYRVGMTEAPMGVPFSRGTFSVLEHAIPDKRALREFVYRGPMMTGAAAFKLGFGHSLSADPRGAALEWLRSTSSQREGVFTSMKRLLNAPFFAAVQDPDPTLNLSLQTTEQYDTTIATMSRAGFTSRGQQLTAAPASATTASPSLAPAPQLRSKL